MMKIDVSKCPHILIKEGAFDDGEYIDDANACKLRGFTYPGDMANSYHMCDSDCEWFQLQQAQTENEELKENYRLSCLKCKFKNAFMILDEIEKIIKDTCFEECDFKWCKGKKHCGDDDCRYMQIMEKIKQAKEGGE